MTNMSYCRFRNTLNDLRDCADSMDEPLASDEEASAQRGLIKLCVQIAADYGDAIERERG